MGILDDFFATHQDQQEVLLGTKTLVVSGQSIPVVWDAVTRSKSGILGGLETSTLATATCQPKSVTGNPKSLLGKRCTVDDAAYRITQVEVGEVAVHFTLIDPASNS
jgi:hypothetical protein